MPEEPKQPSRKAMQIHLSPVIKARIIELAADLGMTQKSFFERLLTWLASQKRPIRYHILGGYDRSMARELAEQVLIKAYDTGDDDDDIGLIGPDLGPLPEHGPGDAQSEPPPAPKSLGGRGRKRGR